MKKSPSATKVAELVHSTSRPRTLNKFYVNYWFKGSTSRFSLFYFLVDMCLTTVLMNTRSSCWIKDTWVSESLKWVVTTWMNDFLLCILDRETNGVRRRHGSGTKCETERTGAPLSVQGWGPRLRSSTFVTWQWTTKWQTSLMNTDFFSRNVIY